MAQVVMLNAYNKLTEFGVRELYYRALVDVCNVDCADALKRVEHITQENGVSRCENVSLHDLPLALYEPTEDWGRLSRLALHALVPADLISRFPHVEQLEQDDIVVFLPPHTVEVRDYVNAVEARFGRIPLLAFSELIWYDGAYWKILPYASYQKNTQGQVVGVL